MTRDDFPILRQHAGNARGFDEAIDAILDGIAAGGIRNAVFNDCKHTLSNAIYGAWSAHVQDPFFYGGRYQKEPKEVQELDWALTVSNLHDVIAAAKRVDKSTLTGPAVDAMREFMKEALPLSLAVASLKDKLIMGRAPNTGPSTPENPNKVVKTCACCFRRIAVVKSLMAHHGYKRPGYGSQTSSCAGIQFRPLEVSSDGLAFITDLTRKEQADNARHLASLPTRTSIHVLERNAHGKRVLVEIMRGDPKFDRECASLKSELEFLDESLKRDLANLEPMLRDWKPADLLLPLVDAPFTVLSNDGDNGNNDEGQSNQSSFPTDR